MVFIFLLYSDTFPHLDTSCQITSLGVCLENEIFILSGIQINYTETINLLTLLNSILKDFKAECAQS